MQFSSAQTFGTTGVLQPYKRLMHDAVIGDRTLFTDASGIERLWTASAPLLQDPPPLQRYAPGRRGPQAIHELIAPDDGGYPRPEPTRHPPRHRNARTQALDTSENSLSPTRAPRDGPHDAGLRRRQRGGFLGGVLSPNRDRAERDRPGKRGASPQESQRTLPMPGGKAVPRGTVRGLYWPSTPSPTAAMLEPQVLLHLREALEGEPDWLEVRTRLQRLAPEGHKAAYRPFVFAFGYLLVERSQTDCRGGAGGPFGAAMASDGWRFPPGGGRRRGARRAGPDEQRPHELPRSFESWRLAPSCAHPTGTPAASQRTERFALFWLLSGAARAWRLGAR